MDRAVAFVIVALLALWLPAMTGSSKPRLPLLALAGILGWISMSRNDWPGMPFGSWLIALPCYITLGGVLLGGLWLHYGDRLREPSFDEIGAKRIAKHVAWGVMQQALLLTFLVDDVGPWWAVGAFALLHLPNPFLALLTLAGGLGSAWIWSFAPSVLIAGLMHATVSAVADAYLPETVTLGMSIGPDALKRLGDRWRFL